MEPEDYENLATTARMIRLDIAQDIPGDAAWLERAEKGARQIVEAMMTPITAEALTADGWQKQHENSRHWFRASGPKYSFLDLDSKRCAFVFRSHITCELSTMYDLRELVRLLGGKA